MQREVAYRPLAVPRTKDYGILSNHFFQLFFDVEILFEVPPTVFYPKPKVTSTLVRLRPLPEPRFPLKDEKFFRSLVRGVFGKRRKTLRNSLRYHLEAEPPATRFRLYGKLTGRAEPGRTCTRLGDEAPHGPARWEGGMKFRTPANGLHSTDIGDRRVLHVADGDQHRPRCGTSRDGGSWSS
ncbi:MAG: hypothetical protein IPI01_16570 [Ignavibacteriae bacterium]|nr:hypothetical protein [Ignavibacteriota bacterium]